MENVIIGDIDNNFTSDKLAFNYLELNKYLYELYKKGIDNINILLLISLETDYYEGETLKQILLDLKRLSNNIICNFEGKETKFKVNKIQIDNGDVLNRHRWIYRYNEEYMLKHNLTEEEQIPKNIKHEIEERAYKRGRQQGIEWFQRNIESFNEIFDNCKTLPKDFEPESGITKLCEGSDTCPEINYICYEYWLKHRKYKTINNVINKIRLIHNSILEKTYNKEAEYFLRRLTKRNEIQYFPEIFLKYSKNYLADETVKQVLIYDEDTNNNTMQFYYGKEIWHNITLRSEKAKNNDLIRNYLENEISSINKVKHIQIMKK